MFTEKWALNSKKSVPLFDDHHDHQLFFLTPGF